MLFVWGRLMCVFVGPEYLLDLNKRNDVERPGDAFVMVSMVFHLWIKKIHHNSKYS